MRITKTAVRPLTVAAVTTALAGLALAGCGTEPASQPSPSSSAPVAGSAPSTETAPTTTTPSSSPSATQCPSGAYTITALRGEGSASQLGSGVGGDVMMSFTDGVWTLQSDGKAPVTTKIGPASAKLTIAGTITGDYSGDASALKLAVKDANGTATIKGGFVNRKLTLKQLSEQIVPLNTTGTATCSGDQAVITLPNVAITMQRT